jgi:hypothetical protein
MASAVQAPAMVTMPELMAMLAVSKVTALKWLRERRFAGAWKTSERGFWRIPRADVESFLARRGVASIGAQGL